MHQIKHQLYFAPNNDSSLDLCRSHWRALLYSTPHAVRHIQSFSMQLYKTVCVALGVVVTPQLTDHYCYVVYVVLY